jgi:dihydrofolate reductase
MTLSCIAATSINRVIGHQGQLPWDLPDDLVNFDRITRGKPFLMGRKSYAIDKPLLSGYRNVILSSRTDLDLCDNCTVAHDLEAAWQLLAGEPEVFVLGGGGVFEQVLPRADRLYLTIVEAVVAGDAFFPAVDWTQWELTRSSRHRPDARHAYAFSLNEYVRKA